MLAVRVILFDAVGTLIAPQPSVAEVYGRLGRRYGSCLSADEIALRFRAAFRRQQEYDRQRHWRTDEHRERQRWRDIVRDVFAELPHTEGLFNELWHHFARPDAWSCFPEVANVLSRLAAHGFQLGIASNFDQRLRLVAHGLPALLPCRWIFISSELGWLKPAAAFFDRITELIGVEKSEILYVGDDYDTDCCSALRAGWHAVWINRASKHPATESHTAAPKLHLTIPPTGEHASIPPRAPPCPTVTSLNELLTLLVPRP
ncbi:MAG: HAD family hydrolase [Gemmatales bacterium]|nr:HAD family hydrolase [Gemmatales bacterium]